MALLYQQEWDLSPAFTQLVFQILKCLSRERKGEGEEIAEMFKSGRGIGVLTFDCSTTLY